MMVILKKDHSKEELDNIMRRLEENGLKGHPIFGVERTVIAVVGRIYPELSDDLETMAGVEDTVPISTPYKLAGRETKPEDTIVRVGAAEIGSDSEGRQTARSARPAGRRVQAADEPVQLSRPRR
jgi:3-deoxy-7-phosphoheptulonate synthase